MTVYDQRLKKKEAGSSSLPVLSDLPSFRAHTTPADDDSDDSCDAAAAPASMSVDDTTRVRLELLVVKSLRDEVFDADEKMAVEAFMSRKDIARSVFEEILLENGWTMRDYHEGTKQSKKRSPRRGGTPPPKRVTVENAVADAEVRIRIGPRHRIHSLHPTMT